MQRTAALLLLAAALIGAWLLLSDGEAPTPDLDGGDSAEGTERDGGPTLTAHGTRPAPQEPAAQADTTATKPPPPEGEEQRAVMVSYRGRVLDADGRPIAGAIVILRIPGADLNAPPHETRTRADGTFEIDADAGRYELIVRAQDGRLLYEQHALVNGVDAVVLSVSDGPALGVIVTQEGKPISGALVKLLPPGSSFDADDLIWRNTDNRGRVSLGTPPRGRYDMEIYTGEGVGVGAHFTHVHDSDAPVRFDLGAYVQVKGKVVDAQDGRAIPEAEVFLRGRRSGDAADFRIDIDAADGTFEVEVPRAMYRDVTVYGEGYGPWPPRGGTREEVKKRTPILLALRNLGRGKPADVTIPLTRAGELSIQGVVRGPDDKPVPGVELTIVEGSSRNWEPTDYALSDEDGRFEVPTLRAGSYRARVATLAWVTKTMPYFIVEEGAERPVEIVVRVQRAGALHGQVVRKDGSPVPGARVWLEQQTTQERQPEEPAPIEVVSGKEGRWHVGALAPNASRWLHAGFGDLRAKPRWSAPNRDANTEIVLTLEPAVTLRVQVIEARTTRGIRGARVKAELAPSYGRPNFTKFCDEDGRFEIQQILPSTWKFTPWSWWHLEHETKAIDLTGTSGVVEVTFELDPGLAIAGRVHDDRGEPLVGTIKISGVDTDKRKIWRELESDKDGLFRATGFRQGRYVLTARADGHSQAVRRELKGGEEHLDLKLMPAKK